MNLSSVKYICQNLNDHICTLNIVLNKTPLERFHKTIKFSILYPRYIWKQKLALAVCLEFAQRWNIYSRPFMYCCKSDYPRTPMWKVVKQTICHGRCPEDTSGLDVIWYDTQWTFWRLFKNVTQYFPIFKVNALLSMC